MNEKNFTRSILSWYDAGHRDLPWRHTTDAYRIWISEIMLQQTRAETVVSYYERFLEKYPSVHALADAKEDELLKAWEGLGYYSRARSLQKAAKIIVQEYGGSLPASVEGLKSLPGIGDYTSGAIASIAFGIPAAAVDGNVERVLCRYYAIEDEVGTPAVRRHIFDLAQALVAKERPGAFANAMMEMGATLCTPRNPACERCPVTQTCAAHQKGIAAQLPNKKKKKPQRVEKRAVLLVFCADRVLIVKREEALLGGLYIFPDALDISDPAALCAQMETHFGVRCAYDGKLGEAKHVFTHIIWEMDIHALEAENMPEVPGGMWVTMEELAALPLPTAVKAARKHAMERLGKSKPMGE